MDADKAIQAVRLDQDGPIAHITIDCPSKRDAFNIGDVAVSFGHLF